MDPATEQPTVFDSEKQHVGTVYAKALIGVGQVSGKTEGLLSELHSLVHDVLPKLSGLRQTLESPRIPFDDKAALIDKSLRAQASPEFIAFLKVLCRKQRFNCIDAVDRAATKIYNEMTNRIEATLITAVPVDGDVNNRIKDQLEKSLQKQVDLNNRIDESIVGGFVVQVGDTVYDGSLINQLKQVRRIAVEKANLEIKKSIDRFVEG